MRRWSLLLLLLLLLVGCRGQGGSPAATASPPPMATPVATLSVPMASAAPSALSSTSGILVRASAIAIVLAPVSAASTTLSITLQPTTQICRQTCSAGWAALRPGDRIATATFRDPSGDTVARWVDANPITQYGTVVAVTATAVTIVPNTGRAADVERVLRIEPDTIVTYASGSTETGTATHLMPADQIYFTGAADSPDVATRDVWVERLYQMRPTP